MTKYDYSTIPTPCFVVEEELLKKNLEILKNVIDRTGCHILLAQKCFSMYHTYPLLSEYLSGTTASGLYEAKLGKEYFGKETHVYSAAYREDEIDEILELCDHIVFNSFSQWEKYKNRAVASGKSCGLRINPQCSTQKGHEIYDPCAPFSRMGITNENFKRDCLEGISGLHFHTLCEQNSDALLTTIKAVREQFGDVLATKEIKWINFGGGHHITREDYDVETLIKCINDMKEEFNLEVYLEPGEAVALDAGFMVSTVLDIIHNGMDIAIMDTSAACHMPDVLEMPYTPVISRVIRNKGELTSSSVSEQNVYRYRLGGPTCLAGDIIGDYEFAAPLNVGDRVIFDDMAIYSMVKTNTFNGMRLPCIAYVRSERKKDMSNLKSDKKEMLNQNKRDALSEAENGMKIELLKQFGYEDFKVRL